MKNKNNLYAGIVWIISGIALIIYGVMVSLNSNIPGAEDLVAFITNIDSKYIYLAAFISVFIEGLYFVGSFFPGSSLVIIVSIIARGGGWFVFLATSVLIFIGWCLASIINIFIAKVYREKLLKQGVIEEYQIENRPWGTWFPSFRASHEVAQIIEGGHPLKVFMSSLHIRFWACVFVATITYIIPFFFDIQKTTDREGYITVIVVAVISLVVGFVKVRQYYRG